MAGEIGKVRPHGRGWRIDFGRRWGPRFLYSFRGSGFSERRMAEAILGWIELECAKGRALVDVISEAAPNAAGDNSIERLVRQWLKNVEALVDVGELSPRTLRGYKVYAKPGGHFSWWDDRSIWEIDDGSLEDWALWLAGKGLSPKYRWNIIAGFSAFCGWVGKRRSTFERPEMPWPKLDRKLPTYTTREVQAQILAAIPEPRRGIFLALADCGIRPNEARVLRVRDWNGLDEIRVVQAAKDGRTVGVRRSTKNRAEKLALVSPRLGEWLEAHVPKARRLARPDGPLFLNPSPQAETGWWSETAMGLAWSNACDRAGVARITLYCGTKHTLGTALKTAGVDDAVIAEIFGHADRRSVEFYRAIEKSAVRGALRKLEE